MSTEHLEALVVTKVLGVIITNNVVLALGHLVKRTQPTGIQD